MTRRIRQTLIVARRDFTATVFTPTFLLFLLAPFFFMGLSAAIGGLGAASLSERVQRDVRIVAIVSPEDGARLMAADTRLRRMFRDLDAPPPLRIDTPAADVPAQARALFDARGVDVSAVLHGPLDRPVILSDESGRRTGDYLAELAEQGLRDDPLAAERRLSTPVRQNIARRTTSPIGEGRAAFFTVFALFFLTLLLAGQVAGSMAEERSNKVIEVLAAAVPLESVFLGKLVGMFGVALVFLAFWGSIALNVTRLVPPEVAQAMSGVGPAIGWPLFVLLFLAYFTMAYMLLGAVFLGIGAQASTPREIQMLSLPITLFQVGMFALSSAAAASPDALVATVAQVFPFSSPFAMGARAANDPALWPHIAALAWQALWVALSVAIGARAFRRGVLQSSGPRIRWFRRAA
jgi:ABC-2 type transport system permease protein